MDLACNMKKVASEIKAIEPTALYMYLHCFARSLNLAVADTLKQIKLTSDTLNHCLEICKLINASPRRDAIFSRLKDEMTPVFLGLRIVSNKMDCSGSLSSEYKGKTMLC